MPIFEYRCDDCQREFEALVDRIAAREIDPYSAAEAILSRSLQRS